MRNQRQEKRTTAVVDCGDMSPLWLHGAKAGKVHFEHFLHRVTCRKSGVMPPQSKESNPASPGFDDTRVISSGSHVAQVSNLPYRRFPIGRMSPLRDPRHETRRRLKRCDTADWKSALRPLLDFLPFDFSHSIVR